MRIFHILADNTTPQAEDNFLSLADAFSDLGFKQCAVIKQDEKLEKWLQEKNIHTVTQKFGGMFDLRTKKVIRAEIEKFTPHIVQGYGDSSLNFYSEAPDNIPFIPVLTLKKPSAGAYNKLLAHTPHAILIGYDAKTDSNAARPYILPPVPGPETEQETPSPLSRDELGIPENAFLIGAIPSLTEDLKLDVILQAIREIPSVHICIAGDGPYKKHLKDVSAKKGVHDRTHFLDFKPDTVNFLKMLDLCIVPDQESDTLRPVFLAWSQGIPVLSCIPPDFSPVEHDKTGWVESDGDILKLRRALQTLISDEALRERLAHNGQIKFKELYSNRKVLGQYLNAYKEILGPVNTN